MIALPGRMLDYSYPRRSPPGKGPMCYVADPVESNHDGRLALDQHGGLISNTYHTS
jgi:hypothetical protein